MDTNIQIIFFSLVRLGIGHDADSLGASVEWDVVKKLADQQGLSAIVLDGIEVLRLQNQHSIALPEKRMLTQWIGEVLQGYEYRYELYRQAIVEMASFYNKHGYKMMVLKGYTCSLDWPKPEHRPTGDIDIWLFGQYKAADKLLSSEFGTVIDNSHHHHTMFYWKEFMVENHYDFVNVHAHKSSADLECVFKELGQDDSHYIEVDDEKVYLPSSDLHALFLVRHMVSHFVGANITLRQVLDWAFFVKKHGAEINVVWFKNMVKKFHMNDFLDCINAICVEELGFNASMFNGVQFNPIIKDLILKDILNPSFESSEPKRLIPRLVYKLRRWQGNAWKYKLCYNESRWSAFWAGIWAKIIKPSTI